MSDGDPIPPARLAPQRRTRLTVGAVVVIVVVALGVAVTMSTVTAAGSAPRPVTGSPATDEVTVVPGGSGGAVSGEGGAGRGAAQELPVLVHVLGEVRSPGIYELSGDARALDAVAAAGGLTEAADPGAVNLARRVADGEQLVVPKVGDPRAPVAGESGGWGAAGGSGADGGVTSLSTASAEQLDALPKIGPTIAQRIVEWRDAGGRFTSVDDLLEIEGVGEKTVAGLRDLVVP